jgi:uncharacterized protein YbaP (TraB family)
MPGEHYRRRFGCARAAAALGLVGLGACALPVGIGQPEPRSLFWELQTERSTIYLLGAMHYANRTFYPLPERVEAAFERCDTLVLEVEPPEVDPHAAAVIALRGRVPAGSDLSRMLSPETGRLLAPALERLGLPPDQFDSLRPWVVALTVISLEFARLGLYEEYGIDQYLLDRSDGKRLAVLESIRDQIRMFERLTDEEQDLALRYSLIDLERVGLQLDQIVAAWRTGDAASFAALTYAPFTQDPALAPIFDRFVRERNQTTSASIERLVKHGGCFFVAVNAGRLVGDQGVVALLQARGYDLHQL